MTSAGRTAATNAARSDREQTRGDGVRGRTNDCFAARALTQATGGDGGTARVVRQRATALQRCDN